MAVPSAGVVFPQRVTQLNPSPPSSFAPKVTFSGDPRAPLFTGMAPLHLHFFCSASSFSTKGSLSNVPGNPRHTWSFVCRLPHLLQLHFSRAELLILFLKVWWWFSRSVMSNSCDSMDCTCQDPLSLEFSN